MKNRECKKRKLWVKLKILYKRKRSFFVFSCNANNKNNFSTFEYRLYIGFFLRMGLKPRSSGTENYCLQRSMSPTYKETLQKITFLVLSQDDNNLMVKSKF